jgi:hypothetical protein
MTDKTDGIRRDVLPIPDRPHTGSITYDASDPDTSFPPIVPLRPPEGAPNVLIILLDDVGFGTASAFGGPCATPNAEALADAGLRYNRFHTTALCAPTRQALLTGRNHHSVGMGGITEVATSAPGYSSIRPNTAAPLAETLKLNGYSTAQFGKCHEVPVWQASPMGPRDGHALPVDQAGRLTLGRDPERHARPLVRMEFAYDDGGLAKGGEVTLYIDGEKSGEGRLEATIPMIFSGDETADVGCDTATPVSDDYGSRGGEFNGEVTWVQIDVDDAAENLDHLITAEERMRIAMFRQ